MKRQAYVALAAAVLLLVAVAVPQTFLTTSTSTSTQPAPLTDGPPLKPSTSYQFRGVAMQAQSADKNVPFETFVDEIAQTGANTFCLSVAAFQENGSSSSIFVDARRMPSDERIEKLVQQAHDHKLQVAFMPIVLLENPGAGEWRGAIHPHELSKWWEDYENYILYYAKVAARANVDLFVVGSELVTLEENTDKWRGLIAKVRKIFPGKLTYSANWDHYKNIQFWNDLDIVGMTSYHDLCGDEKPTLEVLLKKWAPIKAEILDFQRKVNRPILFTEVGWPNLDTAAKEPWNYVRDAKGNPALQALCFESFFETWKDEPGVAGLFIWEWRNYAGQTGGDSDTSYFPGGKPAMQVIRKFFQSSGPWDKTPSSAPASSGSRP